MGLSVQSKDRYAFLQVITSHCVLHTCLFKRVCHVLAGLHNGVMREVVA
jgi:hypothetical protein